MTVKEIRAELDRRLETKNRPASAWRVLAHAEKVTCNDGLSLSVQASETHYCEPRDNSGPWMSVEVGYPSERCEELMEWAEDTSRPTDTVYSWVPISVVASLIHKHGGFKA